MVLARGGPPFTDLCRRVGLALAHSAEVLLDQALVREQLEAERDQFARQARTDPLIGIGNRAVIVFSSNAFAILGLRSLYFLLAGVLPRFAYLKLGLAALLVFAGVKILLSEVWKMPVQLSIAVIVTILAISIVASLWATRSNGPAGVAVEAEPSQRP